MGKAEILVVAHCFTDAERRSLVVENKALEPSERSMIMDDLARRQISGYFAKFPQWTVAALAVGFIITFAAEGPLGYIMGIGALLASGTMGALWIKSRPGDAQMDLWLREDLIELQTRALTKAHLDRSQLVRDNVVVIGVKFQNLGGAAFGFRRGSDGRARFTPMDTTIIN